jgi:hypothetical protein
MQDILLMSNVLIQSRSTTHRSNRAILSSPEGVANSLGSGHRFAALVQQYLIHISEFQVPWDFTI